MAIFLNINYFIFNFKKDAPLIKPSSLVEFSVKNASADMEDGYGFPNKFQLSSSCVALVGE